MVREDVRSRTRDLNDRRRFAFAFAAALALHAALALFSPRPQPHQAETVVATRRVTLAKRAPPTPAPTPPPAKPRPRVTLAPRVTIRAPAPRAAATPRRRPGGAAARRHPNQPRAHLERPAPPVSLAMGVHAGQENGGSGTGAGAGAGDSGRTGAGSGNGSAGNGNGNDAKTGPCADIYLLPGALGYRPDGTVVQQVLAKVVERDGTVEVQKFPYPFIYPGDAADPFRHDAAVSADGGIPVQQPPPDADVSTMPPAVQTVLKYTDPKTGYTTIPACTPDATP